MNGLTTVNIELTSRCSKSCWMCGRRKLEKEHPNLAEWGDMPWGIVEKLAKQIPPNIVIQFHYSGDPLLYPNLKHALKLFKNNIRCFNTNGKLLIKKAKDIIGNMETLTISVIERDPEANEQFEIVKKFLEIKGSNPPYMIYRLLGRVDNSERWYELPGIVATRVLHHPMGSYQYTQKTTIPEIGCCLDLLNHLVIDRFGDVYPCARFNPSKFNLLGNIKKDTLENLWNSPKRKRLIEEHIKQNRSYSPLCNTCEFWGVPMGE